MRTIETSTEINASPAQVWKILTSLEEYRTWNPFITAAEGEPAVGERLRIRIEPPGAQRATFRPTVTMATPNERFGWRGRLFVPGLFDGHHTFTIEALDGDRVRFTQRESFSGLLVPVLLDTASVTAGFERMNEALKTRAQALDTEADGSAVAA
ncbi:MAG: SRPBCC family protein [Halobacteriales archaeon]